MTTAVAITEAVGTITENMGTITEEAVIIATHMCMAGKCIGLMAIVTATGNVFMRRLR
jgi:hypothetical protein